MNITLNKKKTLIERIKEIFFSKDYKPALKYEYTQGSTSIVKRVWTCEVVY
jgi:hypothetical protein